MAEKLRLVLEDLQNQLQSAKIQSLGLSTIARNGDIKLVEQFMTENVFNRGPSSKALESVDNAQDVLQSQFYVACFWGFRDIVKGIISSAKEAGIELNPDHQNKKTLWTPLHAATFQEHGPIIMMLLDIQAQPELPDAEGRTAADFASASDKVWGHFAALGLTRTPRSELVKMGILSRIESAGSRINSASSRSGSSRPGSGIRMAAYSGVRDAMRDGGGGGAAAADMGDVLACDAAPATQNPMLKVFK